MYLNKKDLANLIKEETEKILSEKCWDGYERNPDIPKGQQGSCVKQTNEETIDEAAICAAGKNYVDGKTIGKQRVSRGKDGKFNNWSARAAQIASKYCKDPNYGKGRGKDAKNEELSDDDAETLKDVEGELNKAVKAHKSQAVRIKKIRNKLDESKKNCGCGKDPCKTYGLQEGEGGLKAWEKENWTHSDGTPCGGGKKDGSDSRCKPASKWKTMSKSEKAADNAKKKAGTKAGKQYVPATKKGKVTKSHTKRNENLNEQELEEKKKKPCKKAKGKRYVKRVNGRCRSFGQAGQAKGGGDRIRPGTKKGDAYCARSAKIKKCKNPPCANALSRKKWKCRGSKSMKEQTETNS